MLCKAGKLGVRTGSRENLGIASRDRTATFALERPGYNRGSAALAARLHELIHELDQVVGKANRNLPGHPITVPDCYHPRPKQSPGAGSE